MSSLALSDSFKASSGTVKQTISSTTSTKNYLNRYVECDPAKLAVSHARKEKLWKVASIVCLVAYTVIVALAAILTGVLAPAWLPVAIATAITLTPFVYQFCYLTMQKWSQMNASEARIEEGVTKKLEKIPTEPSQVAALLEKMGTSPKQIKNIDRLSSLTQLRPAIARYQYWAEMADKWLEQSRLQGNKTIGVNQEKAEDPDKVKETRIEALDLLEDSQIAKVRAAFLLHILRNPSLRGDENDNDLFSFKILPPSDRLLRLQFNDPSHGILMNLKDSGKSSMSIQDLIPLAISDVYDRLGSSLNGG